MKKLSLLLLLYTSICCAQTPQFYGMTISGGLHSGGTIFKINADGFIFSFNINTNTYTKLFDFIDSLGRIPKSDLMQASDGLIYGVTTGGGATLKGVLFSFNPATNTYAKKVDFSTAFGMNPYCAL